MSSIGRSFRRRTRSFDTQPEWVELSEGSIAGMPEKFRLSLDGEWELVDGGKRRTGFPAFGITRYRPLFRERPCSAGKGRAAARSYCWEEPNPRAGGKL